MKLKRYPSAEKILCKAVELSPENEIANDTLAEKLFQRSRDVTVNGKLGEEINVLREVVYFNPEHIKAHERLSEAYNEKLSGVKGPPSPQKLNQEGQAL